MTENKENQNEAEVKLEAESKVTTGAWWKSALNLLPGKKKEAVSSSAEEESASDESGVKEKGGAGRGKSTSRSTIKEDDAGSAGAVGGEKEKKPDTRGRQQRAKRGPNPKQVVSKAKPEEDADSSPKEKIVTKLLINAEEPEECRIVLVENGRLESFHVASVVRERTKNNIYKGKLFRLKQICRQHSWRLVVVATVFCLLMRFTLSITEMMLTINIAS